MPASKNGENVARLVERLLELIDCDENRRRRALWQGSPSVARDHWHAVPATGTAAAPITVNLGNQFWGKVLGQFPYAEYYNKPEVYLEYFLKKRIEAFLLLNDDTFLDNCIPIYLGTTFEASLFGARTVYREEGEPALDPVPLLVDDARLERLAVPDFYRDGLMPLAHRYFAVLQEMVGDYCVIQFPDWTRGPFGLAQQLRGFEALLADVKLNAAFVHRLMQFLVRARKHWYSERSRFLGQPVGPGDLFDDEVDANVVSPSVYKGFILPYEKQLCAFHGGIAYWHSCGNVVPMLSDIQDIPSIGLLDIGPWNDKRAALSTLRRAIPLELRLHPVDDVQLSSPHESADRLRGVLEGTPPGSLGPFAIRAGGVQSLHEAEGDRGRLNEWIECMRAMLAGLHAATTTAVFGSSEHP